jgi:hypothetical protein
MYHQYWTKKRPIAGFGATECPAGQVGYPPLCYSIPAGVDQGTEPQGGAVCPSSTPYGTPPWCYAIPGVQPPPGVEPVAGGVCPADKPYGVYPLCFSASSVPQGTQLPQLPIPGTTPGLPSVTEPGKEDKGSEQPVSPPWSTNKKLLVGGLAFGGAALLYLVMKKKA